MSPRATCMILALVGLAPAPVRAELPLQELLSRVRASVVHVSVRDASGKEESSGSGFVASEDGALVTNFHVAADASTIVAVFEDGREVPVVGVRAFDDQSDVAVLQLVPGRYSALPLSARKATPGTEIMVVGSPFGLGHSVSTGIVAAVRERGTKRAGRDEGQENWGLQITAAIAPGSSGSPIVDATGQVIGVAVGEIGEATYFGVPSARIAPLLASRPETPIPLAHVRRGWSIRTNLLVSAAVLGAPILAFWGLTWWSHRRERAEERLRWKR